MSTNTYSMDHDTYEHMYRESLENPAQFWGKQAEKYISWFRTWNTVYTKNETENRDRWFDGATLNVSYNCIDRHVESGHGSEVAYFWEKNDGETVTITYDVLLAEVSKLANVLKNRGVKKGSRVCIYMPMIPEAVYAMLACARIGAVHSVVFGGFSASALKTRIADAACEVIITADVVKRGAKIIPLKAQVDKVIDDCPTVHTCLVVQNTEDSTLSGERFVYYQEAIAEADSHCPPEEMEAEDPFFILYTSGSTGKPKGVLHTTGGYLLYATMTFHRVFDYREHDVFWCTADIGWITGHSYLVYGPLANRATSVLFEGVPTYPTAARVWNVVDKYRVNILYTAPTLIRMLMGQGNEFVTGTSRESLRILGTVGEPINPEAWQWYHDVVGNGKCAIVDTWWQTETGGHAIAPIPGVIENPKPGSAMIPFFGIEPALMDRNGNVLEGEAEGALVLRGAWPGRMRDVYNDHERFLDTYLRPYPGYYCTGDGARRDADGHYWVTGRIDDVMKISGHLIGTAEVENALTSHDLVSEAAVVAIPHDIKGGSMQAFVCLDAGKEVSDGFVSELITIVREHVGPFAKPDHVYVVSSLPKTRSGKIVRRLLRKIASGKTEDLGDTSTLADQTVLDDLIKAVGEQSVADR